jgi:hypothetical protein
MRVGDPADLPLGSGDPALLLWAEREQRILVKHDPDTMPRHLADHLAAGRHSSGVFMIRPHRTLPQILSFLMRCRLRQRASGMGRPDSVHSVGIPGFAPKPI